VTRNHKLFACTITATFLFCLNLPEAVARDRGFGAVVRQIETTYHVKRNYRFLMWMTGIAVKVARPEGVKGLKIAIFEDQDFSPRANDAEFETNLRSAMGPDWQPLVRISSRHDGERTHIYAQNSAKDIHLFIVTLEESEAVVMEVKMSARKFDELMNDPANFSASLRNETREGDEQAASEEAAPDPPALRHRETNSSNLP
jgi:hypothetical protein